MTKSHLDDVYAVAGDSAVRDFYDNWAASYDAEVTANGYATPMRAAKMLVQAGVPFDAPILDYGCGTGLSGAAFARCGFTRIDGTDLSTEMLARAEALQIYRRLWTTDPDALPTVEPGDYAAIAAIGVISPGAGPPSLMHTLADCLASGAKLLFSINSHGLADAAYMAALTELRSNERMILAAEEHGTHLPERAMTSTLYLFERA